MDAPKTPIERTRRNKQTRNPEEIQNTTEKPLQKTDQGIENIEQTSQGNSQEDTQPVSEHMTEQFLKIYEEEIAQVLGSLGASIERDKSKENQERASSSNPAENFLDIEMSFPEDTAHEEPHPKERSPVEWTKHLKGT